MTPSILSRDKNSGFQVGINHGQIEAQFRITGNISIQNITTIRPLADSIYTSLFNAPETFNQVRNELGLLLFVLKITEDQISNAGSNDPQSPELNNTLIGCYGVLEDLQRLKAHYDEVGFQTQTTWERMGWGVEVLAEIRARFSSFIQVLNLLNTNMIRSSQETVVSMLKTYIKECQSGKREGAAMSCVSTGSLDADEQEAWRSVRKDLQSVGITPDLFQRHRPVILSTIQEHLTPEAEAESPIAAHPYAENPSPLLFNAEISRLTDPVAGLRYEELYSLLNLERTQHDESLDLSSVVIQSSSFIRALMDEIRLFLELRPTESPDRDKQLEYLHQDLTLNFMREQHLDLTIARKYARQFHKMSKVPDAVHVRIVYEALRTFRRSRAISTRGKLSTVQPSIRSGEFDGWGISSHNKIEPGDILSIAPLAVDDQALHPASTDCPICKYDTEIPHLSMQFNEDRIGTLDGSADNLIQPIYNITPSRHRSHCSYFTPPRRYDSQCIPSMEAQRPVPELSDRSSFNTRPNEGDTVFVPYPTDLPDEDKPSRVVVPRTTGPSYFPPSHQPSQNELLSQYPTRPYKSTIQTKPLLFDTGHLRQSPPLQSKPFQYEPLQ